MTLVYTAAQKDAGRKVYHILKNELRLSNELIKRLKRAGGIFVDGAPVYTDRLLSPGETLTADLSLTEPGPDFPAQEGPLEVLFESSGLLAVNKPAGMLTHPSRGKYTDTLANYAAGHLRGGPVHAVNRLDRDTSGVVLFAKCAHMKTLATQSLLTGGKTYLAALCGALPEERGSVDLPIAREREGFQRRVVREDGKRAVTEYETLARRVISGQTVTAVRFRLLTGRTHQIRVHCAHLGAPILGDRLYGDSRSLALSHSLGLTAHLLHARELSFADPVTGEDIRITAPVRRTDMDIFDFEGFD